MCYDGPVSGTTARKHCDRRQRIGALHARMGRLLRRCWLSVQKIQASEFIQALYAAWQTIETELLKGVTDAIQQETYWQALQTGLQGPDRVEYRPIHD